MNKNLKILKFPGGFIWGVSTSAYQVEGGNKNDWTEWEKTKLRIKNLELKGLNSNDFICGKACDSYNKYEEDLELIKELNCGGFRLGIEWARIEPEEGKWNMAEIEHYRRLISSVKNKGIKTVLTVWHWTNPIWVARQGGWTNKKTVGDYLRFAELIARELGSLVDFWITLNEPMAHVGFGYIRGNFPPAKKFHFFSAIKVFFNLARAHNLAYKKIHAILPDAKVSFTSLTDYFEPANKFNPLDKLANAAARYLHHRAFLNRVKNHLDFVAFDYYFHNRISCLPPFKVNKNKEVNDMGWEIYPEGIYYVIKYLSKFKKPIYVMENGIADEDDDQRPEFIKDHLRYIHKAITEGADMRGYFYWSLLDNFEWAHGFGPKFGLYSVDRNTFKRTPRPSARVYAEICKNNKIILNS